MQTTDPTSNAILAIRAKYGNACTTCPTCTRPANAPYRRTTPGSDSIVEGCIDAAHTPFLAPVEGAQEQAPDVAWHWRKSAKRHRAALLALLAKLWLTSSASLR